MRRPPSLPTSNRPRTAPRPAHPTAPTRGRLELAAVLTVVAAIVTAAHWPVLGAQAQSLDDNLFLTENSLVNQPGWASTRRFFTEVLRPSSVAGYYLPVSMTSLMLDVAMGGSATNFTAFHRTSLVLHVIVTLLIVLLLHQLFGSAIPAGIAGLLFGVHPVTVESVAWLSQRKTLLAAFCIGCLAAYVRHRRGGGRLWWYASILLHGLALMSKPTAVTLPVLLVLMDWWPLRRKLGPSLMEKWPFSLLSLTSSAIAVVSQVGTMGITALPEAGLLRIVLQICYLQAFYLRQIVWPGVLSAVHPPPEPVALSHPPILLSVLAVGVLGALLTLSLRRSRGPLSAWLFFLVALAPTFGVLVWSVIIAYDNYLYLPALGVLLLVGSGLSALWKSRALGGRGAMAAMLGAVLLLTAGEIRATRATIRYWRNDDTLWRHYIDVLPYSHALRHKYGVLLSNQEKHDEAIPHLRRAIELIPGDAETHHNLGRALARAGHLEAAIPELAIADSLAPNQPEYARELAFTLRLVGRPAEAEARYRDVLRLRPRDADALGQIGALLAARGRTTEALEMARRAVALEPQNARAHFTMALVLTLTGSADAEVRDHLKQAVQYEPEWGEASNGLAWLLATSPDPAVFDPGEALRLSRLAVELSGGKHPGALDTHAAAKAAAGQFAAAVETARGAASLADSLHADTLAKAIRKRIAIYRRGLRFVERRGPAGTP